MPPRKKQAPQAPSTMKELKDTLWKAADKLRGSLSASQYKDVILGLVFLKYVSDAYDERREAIRAELAAEGMEESQIEDLIDDPEQYQGYGVFVVPVSARWKFLAENTKGKPAVGGEPAKNIGQLIDEAMDAVMKANPTLGGTLPRLYNKDNIDQRRLGELIDLFNSARFSRQGEHRDRGPASAPGARADLPHRVRLVAAGAKVSAVAETAPLRVQLIAKTDFLAPPDVPWTTDADGGPALVEFAGRACYQSWSKPNPKTATNAGYLRHIIDVGHFSVLEHASVSFYITGISRSCTHELIRHRHFSYSQLSQRYVPEKDSRVVVPPGMEDDADLRHILTEAADAARATYSELLAKLEAKFADQPNAILRRKQARQAARAVLPNATETRIVVTGNYRAWRHFIAMRASEHADVEIRRLAIECLRQLAAVAPAVFADFEVTTLADGTEVATSPLATEA